MTGYEAKIVKGYRNANLANVFARYEWGRTLGDSTLSHSAGAFDRVTQWRMLWRDSWATVTPMNAQSLTRSKFLTYSWIVLALVGATFGYPQEKLELKPGVKQLFLDDYLIKEVHNLRRVLHQPEKISAEPVIRPEHSWESVNASTRSAPFWDPAEQVWKLYYMCNSENKVSGEARSGQCLAISKDGLHWTKPKLGLVERDGSKDNNIVAEQLYQVIFDASGGSERYKGLFGSSGRKPAVSADGLHWRMLEVPLIPSRDESQLIYDELAGQYLATVKHEGPYGRSVFLTTSRDFREWSPPRLIFHADGEDQDRSRKRISGRLTDARFAPLTLNRPGDYNVDVYNMPVFPYGGIYIGTPMFFNQSGPTPIGNSEGFHHVELVTSRDLIRWERVAGRVPFMETSHVGSGAYDTVQLVPANRPVVRDDELWFYHAGNKYRFNPDTIRTRPDGSKTWGFPDDTGAIYVSRLRLDGFVSLDAGELNGELLTRPLILRGRLLMVNAHVRDGGFLRAEILDATGRRTMEGFSLVNATALAGDQLRAPLSWQVGKDLGALAGQEVRLRFVFREASLYAFWLAE